MLNPAQPAQTQPAHTLSMWYWLQQTAATSIGCDSGRRSSEGHTESTTWPQPIGKLPLEETDVFIPCWLVTCATHLHTRIRCSGRHDCWACAITCQCRPVVVTSCWLQQPSPYAVAVASVLMSQVTLPYAAHSLTYAHVPMGSDVYVSPVRLHMLPE